MNGPAHSMDPPATGFAGLTGGKRSPAFAAQELRRFIRWLVVVNLIVGSVLGMATFQALRASHEVQATRARNATENLVEGLQYSIAAQLKLVDSALLHTRLALAHLDGQSQAHRSQVEQILDEQQALMPQLESLRVANAQGQLRFGLGMQDAPALDISDLEFFRRARAAAADDLIVSEPLESRVNGRWILVLARRLSDGHGRFAGIVYGTLVTEHFQDMFRALTVGRHGALTLRSASMRLVARYTPGEAGPQPLGSPRVSGELAAAVAHDPAQGFFVSRTAIDGIERTNAYRRVEPFGLYVLAGLSTEEFFGPWHVDVAARIGLVSVLMLLLVTSSALLLRSRARQYRAQQAADRLASEQALMLDNDLIGIIRLKERQITWVNKGTERLSGYQAHELVGRSVRMLYSDDAAFEAFGQAAYMQLRVGRPYRTQVVLRRKSGEPIWVDASGTWLQGQPGESVWMTLDVTKEKLQHDEVVHAALYDLLTGLPNRRLLLERLALCMQSCERARGHLAVAFVDLDGFKAVNDTHGHDAGDAVLRVVAQRMEGAVRACDTVARIGGDEFVIVLDDLDEATRCGAILERVQAAVYEPIDIPGKGACAVSASIGVALYGPAHQTAESLLTAADEAMYQAKKDGRHCIRGAPTGQWTESAQDG